MGDESLGNVIVNSQYRDGVPNEAETRHEEVHLLAFWADNLHVWFNGTHYVGQGVATTVNEGDLFFRTSPETQIHRVISVDESKKSSARGVEVESLYGSHLESGETMRDGTSVDELTGKMEGTTMGYSGPPTLIREA